MVVYYPRFEALTAQTVHVYYGLPSGCSIVWSRVVVEYNNLNEGELAVEKNYDITIKVIHCAPG